VKTEGPSTRTVLKFFSNSCYQITILAAAEGEHKLPSINGSGNLKDALQKLGSIPSSKLLVRSMLV